ncbi:MAG: hypothetical protein GC202_13720 [Alphaproteobacteria bacterium]|nr:hypothetical protein [Alphaproteobacteria bacterium]
MEFRAIVSAWIVAGVVIAGALYFSSAQNRSTELAGIEPGIRVPMHQQLPLSSRVSPDFEPMEAYPGDR